MMPDKTLQQVTDNDENSTLRRQMTPHELAVKYCREQLAIMDGTFEAALQRIGTERYDAMVKKVAKVFLELRGEYTKERP